MEKRGVPTVVVVGNGFETAARSFAKAYKSPHLRLLLVDDTVAHQGGDVVHRPSGRAPVREAGGETILQPDRPVRGAQQQGARVRGHHAAAEIGHHRTAIETCKLHRGQATLCGHRGASLQLIRSLLQKNFLTCRAPMHPLLVRNPG